MIKTEYDLRVNAHPDDDIDLNQVTKEVSNVIYCSHTVKGVDALEGVYLIGDELGNISKYKMDYTKQEHLDTFSGHSMGIRSIEVTKDGKRMATACADHSIRIWDFETCKAK